MKGAIIMDPLGITFLIGIVAGLGALGRQKDKAIEKRKHEEFMAQTRRFESEREESEPRRDHSYQYRPIQMPIFTPLPFTPDTREIDYSPNFAGNFLESLSDYDGPVDLSFLDDCRFRKKFGHWPAGARSKAASMKFFIY